MTIRKRQRIKMGVKAKEILRLVRDNPNLTIREVNERLKTKLGSGTSGCTISAVRELYRQGFFDQARVNSL